jgi:hypothetical protein
MFQKKKTMKQKKNNKKKTNKKQTNKSFKLEDAHIYTFIIYS